MASDLRTVARPLPTKLAKFDEKYGLGFTLLSDPDHATAEAFGVWGEKTFMGRRFMGINRTTFVIDRDGRIAHVFENVKPAGHASDVADVVAKLS